ncbi:MAG: creatininase family protein [Candidatus Lokiarchaeota archaeon]|nr:creatininase family protein [Candidatus Lokiarchaeota archaeon]
METVRIDEMTWVDVKEKIENGYTTVIFGVGSTEQHGPSLPEQTDAKQADEFANIIALELGKTLQAPTINVGFSKYHMHFPGTITLRKETLSALIEDYINSLASHGFENIIIFISHGGNEEPVQKVLPGLQEKYPDKKIFYYYTQEILPAMREMGQKYDLSFGEIGSHAGDMEASVMLHLAPELVRKERLAKGYVKMITPRIRKKYRANGFQTITENGVVGDQTRATAEKGKDYMKHFKKVVFNYIRQKLEE